jgi:hypothetical protein
MMLNSAHILNCSHTVNREFLESEWVGWQDLAQDSSSYRMRVCVMQGMRTVLANHQTHSFLRPVLPFLVNQIHDVNEHVRIAVIQLLEYVKGHKSFKVCRREVDCNRVVVTASVDSAVTAKNKKNIFLNYRICEYYFFNNHKTLPLLRK